MDIFLIIFFAILGLIIGSFLNVVILRYNTGKGLGGRSQCFSCGRTLRGLDLIPALSYLCFGGRCRTCKSKISVQYILVEVATACLFVFVYWHNAPLIQHNALIIAIKMVVDCAIVSLLVAMTAYDIRHKIIPDPAVFLFALLALISQIIIGALSWWVILAGIILALPFYLIWLLSRGTWMGLGDAKLALGIGWMLGLSAGGTAIIFGFWFGALFSILILICRPETSHLRRLTIIATTAALSAYFIHYYALIVFAALYLFYVFSRSPYGKYLIRKGYIPNLNFKSEVPFAPFLILGLLTVYVLGYNLFIFSV